ncbi:MAG TPA: fatty acyl-AMP ligase [Solirubrobacterales bacterium]|nr:fatty acyl-AMP ligase [Solirubrobacterales bacterium]
MKGGSRTLSSLLIERASHTPDAVAYIYLRDRGEPEELTFATLLSRAQSLAGTLCDEGATGRPVLLPLERPTDYATGFFACLFAGAVPTSAAPLQRLRLSATAAQLAAVAADCGATLALGSERTIATVEAEGGRLPALAALRWIGLERTGAGVIQSPEDPDALAYLQYTSGSIDRPKAVALPHRSLLANLESQRQALSLSAETRMATWLPLSHDMGFVAPVLQPVSLGCRTIFLSPTSFLLRPVRWLEVVDEHRCTLSAAPNFAYELTARRVAPEDRARLDLSSWTHAVNGAEPVRAETMARFAEAFAAAGFRDEAFVPSFGMAEVTCMATCAEAPWRSTVRRLDRTRLSEGRAVEAAAGDPRGDDRVSCGSPTVGTRVEIVDPRTRRPLAEGVVGEVWIAGPSVGLGYLGRADETAAVFGARLADDPDTHFMRTGDLGFLLDGELFVSGRLKDLIIVRGRNYPPHDIEVTAAGSHPSLAPDAAAAFSVETPDGEGLAVVQEVASVRGVDCDDITQAVKAALSQRHGLRPHVVALLGPGGLPKTASGKVRRLACRAALAEGRLERALSITLTGSEVDPSGG